VPAGSLSIYRLHARDCKHRAKGRKWTRCQCAIWTQGSLSGRWVKMSLHTRNWAAAAKIIHNWEATGKIGEEPPDIPTIKRAIEKYLVDAEARHLAPETVRKRRELLEGKLLPFCEAKGYAMLAHLDVDVLRTFRASWPYSPLSARKRLEYLRSFFRCCHDSGWVDRNPALAVKGSKVEPNPTLPFSDDEVERILVAARDLKDFWSYGPKIEPMVLLLRYSGLRMQDAACLARERLVGDKLFLYQQKTGLPVYCPLPPSVVKKLNALENENERFFFYDGTSQPQSMVKSWDRVFQKVFVTAQPAIKGGHPHRFRDTFAVSLLIKGVSIEIVSKLLGHSSIKVTERHYSPWVKARQEQLETEVRRIWTAADAAIL
jgi:integrase/recombinase XerD